MQPRGRFVMYQSPSFASQSPDVCVLKSTSHIDTKKRRFVDMMATQHTLRLRDAQQSSALVTAQPANKTGGATQLTFFRNGWPDRDLKTKRRDLEISRRELQKLKMDAFGAQASRALPVLVLGNGKISVHVLFALARSGGWSSVGRPGARDKMWNAASKKINFFFCHAAQAGQRVLCTAHPQVHWLSVGTDWGADLAIFRVSQWDAVTAIVGR